MPRAPSQSARPPCQQERLEPDAHPRPGSEPLASAFVLPRDRVRIRKSLITFGVSARYFERKKLLAPASQRQHVHRCQRPGTSRIEEPKPRLSRKAHRAVSLLYVPRSPSAEHPTELLRAQRWRERVCEPAPCAFSITLNARRQNSPRATENKPELAARSPSNSRICSIQHPHPRRYSHKPIPLDVIPDGPKSGGAVFVDTAWCAAGFQRR